MQIKQFFYDLPFKDRQRIIEAVIAPVNGGECILRYLTPLDLVEHIDEELVYKRLTDREPVIEMDFQMDIDRVEALITGLNRKKLFSNFDLYLQLRLPQTSTPH